LICSTFGSIWFSGAHSPERTIAAAARDALLKLAPPAGFFPQKATLHICRGTASLIWTLADDQNAACLLPGDVIEDNPAAGEDCCPARTRQLLQKIRDDRERLHRLLEMYYAQEPSRETLNDLHRAMDERRGLYDKDLLSAQSVDGGRIEGMPEGGPAAAGSEAARRGFRLPGGRLTLAGLVLLALILAGGGLFALSRLACQEKKPGIESLLALPDDLPAENEELYRIKYGMHIDGRAIFNYANEIAVFNGYSAFPYADYQKKNPHWIFPGNSFKLPNNGDVRVKKGDSLWSIAGVELRRREMAFYYALDRCEQMLMKDGALPPDAVKYLESIAATPAHTQALEALRSRVAPDAGK
jgi:hypothetical protein